MMGFEMSGDSTDFLRAALFCTIALFLIRLSVATASAQSWEGEQQWRDGLRQLSCAAKQWIIFENSWPRRMGDTPKDELRARISTHLANGEKALLSSGLPDTEGERGGEVVERILRAPLGTSPAIVAGMIYRGSIESEYEHVRAELSFGLDLNEEQRRTLIAKVEQRYAAQCDGTLEPAQ